MNNKLKGFMALMLSGFIAAPLAAQTVVPSFDANAPWSITASMGVGTLPYMEGTHGQTALGRLAFDYAITPYLGLELGIQNGNHMRFALPKETVMNFGGVPVEGTLKPSLDALISAKTPYVHSRFPLYGLVKGGVAYRQLQMDRDSINDVAQTAPEVQAGLAYQINQHVDIHLVYQYIAGKNPDIQVNPLTETGSIAAIPTQRAALIGLRFNLE